MSFHLDNVVSSHRLLSEHITAAAIATNQTWPFVTIPHFEVEASYCRQTSGVEILSIQPIIGEDDIDAWGPYSVENQGWLQESRTIIKKSGRAGTLTLSSYVEGNITPLVFEAADVYFTLIIPSRNFPVAPVWYVVLSLVNQTHPVSPSNLFSILQIYWFFAGKYLRLCFILPLSTSTYV
jgi:hypothetical protein